LVLCCNNAAVFDATVESATQEKFAGPKGTNSFIKSSTKTPYIPDLVGGAEVFGLLYGIDAQDSYFAPLRNSAPTGSVLALWRPSSGPVGYDDDYEGYDLVLMVNLMSVGVNAPKLGVDTEGTDNSFLQPLLKGGYDFETPTQLSVLGANGVYAILVPEGSALFNAKTTKSGEVASISQSLALGEMAFDLSGEPTPTPTARVIDPDLDNDGDVDTIDLLLMIQGAEGSDVNSDGAVDYGDFFDFALHWME